jgi:transcription termination/antitermination protein NusG
VQTIESTQRRAQGGEAQPSGWHALWTHSQCEALVRDQLVARGFDVFLPQLERWSFRGSKRSRRTAPLFPGYLFLNHPGLDKHSYLEVCRVRGLVRILGERWDRLAVVPTTQIEAVRTILQSEAEPRPYPYLASGRRVRICEGPLRDVEGFLVDATDDRPLLVVSIELFCRSLSVEIDGNLVAPC